MLEIFLNREDMIDEFLYSQKRKEDVVGNPAVLKTLLTDFLDFLIDTGKLSDSSVDSIPMVFATVTKRRSLMPVTIEEIEKFFVGNQSVDRLVMDEREVIFREKKRLKKTADGTIFFGTWPQGEHGEWEELEWIVPVTKAKKLLLVSKKAIVNRTFDEGGKCCWEDSGICQWLNNYFYQYAFSDEEKGRIVLSGSDKVFLLSIQEVTKFVSFEEQRKVEPTAFAVKNGAGVDKKGNAFWWLRSAGTGPGGIACVDPDGFINENGFNCENHFITIRPAIWIMQEEE